MVLPLTAPEGELSITYILQENPNKRTVKDIQNYTEKMAMHNTGKNFDKYIERMDYYEVAALSKLREMYAPTNKDTCARLHRPLDKIYTAKGGSATYYLPENLKPKFFEILKDVKDGESVREWCSRHWFVAMQYDPMALLFMEVDKDGMAYPTYKSAELVYDYPLPKGRKVGYVVFCMPEKDEWAKKQPNYGGEKYYRVVDDAYDYVIKYDSVGQASIVEDETLPNYWGEVPAITFGWIFDNTKKWFVCLDDQIENALDQFMRERSVVTMFRMHHGFPLKWQLGMDCPRCKGSGHTSGDLCSSCGGTGNKSKNDVAETIYVKPPKNKEQPFLAPNIAGYVVPPVESLKAMEENINHMFKEMHMTSWGTHEIEDSSKTKRATATGRFIDVQPVNDKLISVSKAAEYVEMWICNMLGKWEFGDVYKGCHINLGRRYMIETPDQIIQRYTELRKLGASLGVLNETYIQWMEAEYQSDDIKFHEKYMLFKLEPFPHMTNEEVHALDLPPEEYFRKLYFQQWVNQLPENSLILKSYDELFADLEEYVDGLSLELQSTTEQPNTANQK